MYDETEQQIWNKYIFFPERLLWDRADQQTKDSHWFYCDMQNIAKYYHRYKKGVAYAPEGHIETRTKKSEIDGREIKSEQVAYRPSRVRIKQIAKVINKQARFMFGAKPDIALNIDMDDGSEDAETKKALTITQEMMDNVLKRNKFYAELIKAFKDCCIGKRVACILNFDAIAGATIEFLSAFHFTYSYDPMNPGTLAKFEFHKVLPDCIADNPLYIKKRYWLQYDYENYDPAVDKRYCHIEEIIYNAQGEDVTSSYEEEHGKRFSGRTDLTYIPAEVIVNTGLLDQKQGVSDVEDLECNESWYNFLSGLNVDALKKNMNPMKYTVDMDSSTTSRMTNKLGGYVDLQSDRKDPTSKKAEIGMLESSMNYTEPLKEIMETFEQQIHDSVDVPNINLETMASTITSGKALRAIYWGLIQRCDEKMTTWAPAIENIITKLINGLYVYPDIAAMYLSAEPMPMQLFFEVEVTRNNPIPEDEEEEKQIDMQEVSAGLKSRQAYMMKWHNMTDVQANQQLIQIAIENNLLDNLALPETDDSDNLLVSMINEQYSDGISNVEEEADTIILDDNI